eukprot:TRINITY_DN784_c0_g1_i3.p1 TRINITY_DN784_c0_g1~~TRINITY_DN784_c0_g1_i3.p1  ORF type:complete len:234 (-),score=46.18 TRINITY_DN784_c0_g1_i3:448-1149(-)
MAFVAGTAAMPRVGQRQSVRSTAAVRPAAMAATVTSSRRASFFGASVAQTSPAPKAQSPVLSMKLRVAVVGGGPAGSCCAEELAKAGIEVHLFERKMDNAKPCGGAIPLCMVDEFSLPEEIIDRKVRKMAMISPSNKVSQIGATLKPHEYIGMTRREILDGVPPGPRHLARRQAHQWPRDGHQDSVGRELVGAVRDLLFGLCGEHQGWRPGQDPGGRLHHWGGRRQLARRQGY